MTLMLSGILLAALALVANGHPGSANVDRYLGYDFDVESKIYPGFVQEALQQLGVPDTAKPTEIVSMLEHAAHEVKNPGASDLYEHLASLGQAGSECSSLMLDTAETMYKHRDMPVLDQFQEFMQVVGGKKLAQCAEVLVADFNELPKTEYETAFDEFYVAAFDLKSGASDAELIAKLGDFDITKDDFDLWSASAVAERYNIQRRIYKVSPAASTKRFIGFNCEIDAEVQDVLQAVNLATAYGSYQLKHERLMKVNEYSRLCKAFSASRDQIKDRFQTLS